MKEIAEDPWPAVMPPDFSIAALVMGPKYPTAGVMPLAFWKATSAASVAGPKRSVSFPSEPGPEEDTIYPWLFSHTWRALTAGPVEPIDRSVVNGYGADADGILATAVEVEMLGTDVSELR